MKVKKPLKLIGIFICFLLLPLGVSLQAHLYQEEPPLKVLVAIPEGLSAKFVEEGFYSNVPDELLKKVHFIPLEKALLHQTVDVIQTEHPDLIVLSKIFTLKGHFLDLFLFQTWPLIHDLADYRLELIDAGLRVFAVENYTVGAELPWDSNFVISIAEGTSLFEEAFSFLKAIAQNILNFQIDGKPVSVKAHNLSNDTEGKVYGVNLEYDKLPADADAEDNRDWECWVEGNKVHCRTEVGLAPGKRLAVGVAFRSEEPGRLIGCWWEKRNGAEAGGC
ncbi:MAG TPA: hypothetical protein ENF46_01735 [Candidatus Acetothermia bacterium]|nr:hypothetical protein [Candidatus Acetothermia bacterium]